MAASQPEHLVYSMEKDEVAVQRPSGEQVPEQAVQMLLEVPHGL